MSVVDGFHSLSSYLVRRQTSMGFGNCKRFENIYFPLHRDPQIVSATESIERPDIATTVPLAGDTGAAKGQEDQKNDATINRKLTLSTATQGAPVGRSTTATTTAASDANGNAGGQQKKEQGPVGDGEQQEGKGAPPLPPPSTTPARPSTTTTPSLDEGDELQDSDGEANGDGDVVEGSGKGYSEAAVEHVRVRELNKQQQQGRGGDRGGGDGQKHKKAKSPEDQYAQGKRRRLEHQESLYWLA